jgi:hypothetical protein
MSKRKARGKGGYRAIRGISWAKDGGGWVNVEPGKIRTDIPPKHVAGFIEVGAIEPVDLEEPEQPDEPVTPGEV